MVVYLVSYDITDDHARNRVARILMEHGQRVQKSVFEISLRHAAELEQLCQRIAKELDEETNVRFYRLCQPCQQHSRQLDGSKVAYFPAVVVI